MPRDGHNARLTSHYTPLDTLIDTVLRVSDRIGLVSEALVDRHPSVDEEGQEITLLEAAQKDLWTALASHVAGIHDDSPQGTAADNPGAWRYSDGTVIAEVIEIEPGLITLYYPRYDGDREEFVARLNSLRKPSLRLVAKEDS